jgi:hypothetical protein
MNETELTVEINTLKKEIANLKNDAESDKKKDFWIKLVSSILLPLAIAASGYWFSMAIKTQELKFTAKQTQERDSVANAQYQQQLQLSLKTQRLESYKLITPLLDIMTGPDDKRKALATNLIMHIIPDEGPQILNIAISADPANKKVYQAKLDDQQANLIAGLFASNSTDRISAANEIMVGWYKNADMIQGMVDYASQHMDNSNGIYNTVIVLGNMHGRVLTIKKNAVQSFLEKVMAMKGMSKTVSLASDLHAEMSKL